MDNSQIENALIRLFDEEGHRIVFWNDPDQEFAITLSLLNLPEGVTILRLDQIGSLEAKIRMERDDPEEALTGSSLRLALSIFKQELNGDLTTSLQTANTNQRTTF